ncbi:hypothetical protein [Adlercreutzia sp. ZJ138]|nr:hypothetical protein [Adlercreutzia sp. ZJ138]
MSQGEKSGKSVYYLTLCMAMRLLSEQGSLSGFKLDAISFDE